MNIVKKYGKTKRRTKLKRRTKRNFRVNKKSRKNLKKKTKIKGGTPGKWQRRLQVQFGFTSGLTEDELKQLVSDKCPPTCSRVEIKALRALGHLHADRARAEAAKVEAAGAEAEAEEERFANDTIMKQYMISEGYNELMSNDKTKPLAETIGLQGSVDAIDIVINSKTRSEEFNHMKSTMIESGGNKFTALALAQNPKHVYVGGGSGNKRVEKRI